jgi:hypothetical protein
MEMTIKAAFLIAMSIALLGSYSGGLKIISQKKNKGKALVDLLATCFASTGLFGAFVNLISVTHVQNGKLQFSYNIFAEPSPSILFLAALLLSASLGLSLAKRVTDYRNA